MHERCRSRFQQDQRSRAGWRTDAHAAYSAGPGAGHGAETGPQAQKDQGVVDAEYVDVDERKSA